MSDSDPKHDARWDAVEDATELLRDGDSEGAIRALNAVLDGDPGNSYAQHFLGAAHFERGEFDESRRAYEQAVKLAPAYLGAVVGLGHALRMMGRLEEAKKTGERALAMGASPQGDPDAHYLLGLTFAARGEATRAIWHLESFVASNPELEVRQRGHGRGRRANY